MPRKPLPKRWSEGQRAIHALANKPVRRANCECSIILVENLSGASTVVDRLERESRTGRGRRTIGVIAEAAWDAITALCKITGIKQRGTYTDTIWDCLTALSEDGKRDVCLLLEEAHCMRPKEMERLLLAMDWVARQQELRVRVVLLCNRVDKWLNKEQVYDYVWPRLPKRFVGWTKGRGRDAETFPGRVPVGEIKKCTRKGFDALRKAESLPLFEQDHTERAAG